jgi:hypothetical protein
MAASSAGAKIRIATAATTATKASIQASGGDRNESPASSSLCRIAIVAAGPRNAKTSSASATPAASMS